jgi:hypothetical protein
VITFLEKPATDDALAAAPALQQREESQVSRGSS